MVKKNVRKTFNKIDRNFKNKKFVGALEDIGKYTQKNILPEVVSTMVPIASTALGALATTYGGPLAGDAVNNLSSNLMEQYIPSKYQSKNKYTGMLGDAMSMGLSGDMDPNQMMNLQNQFLGQVSKDLEPKYKKPNFDSKLYTNNFITRPNINYTMPNNNIKYDEDNPYTDLLQRYNNIQPELQQPILQNNDNEANDALYKNSESNNDTIKNTSSPYQQKEGSMNGLLGAGIKPKNKTSVSKKSKSVRNIKKFETPLYRNFRHSRNDALEQLLEANEYKKNKESKRVMDEMNIRQNNMLKQYGY